MKNYAFNICLLSTFSSTVICWMVSNCIEFGTIKIGVVELLPNTNLLSNPVQRYYINFKNPNFRGCTADPHGLGGGANAKASILIIFYIQFHIMYVVHVLVKAEKVVIVGRGFALLFPIGAFGLITRTVGTFV